MSRGDYAADRAARSGVSQPYALVGSQHGAASGHFQDTWRVRRGLGQARALVVVVGAGTATITRILIFVLVVRGSNTLLNERREDGVLLLLEKLHLVNKPEQPQFSDVVGQKISSGYFAGLTS